MLLCSSDLELSRCYCKLLFGVHEDRDAVGRRDVADIVRAYYVCVYVYVYIYIYIYNMLYHITLYHSIA